MEFKFDVKKDIMDEIFDEKGNSVLRAAMVSWNDRPAKLELRKWVMGSDGELTPNKGFSFLTEDGPTELVHTLVKYGYGDKPTIISLLDEREDVPKENEETSDSFYDPSELLEEE